MSAEWTAGYVTDVSYTHGYYAELNPRRAALALLDARLLSRAPQRACELGFGQGVSVNVHAAASGMEWWGTDFNPAQAAFADELARDAGAGARLFELAFDEFCTRDDLPDFDFIGLHGIWSWISDHNRKVIVDFIRRRLRPGGVLYISYNTQPGWAQMLPMRELLTEHDATLGTPGKGVARRIDDSLEFARQLLATNPLYAKANPQVAGRLERMGGQNRAYLAHEYFNRDWSPMSFATMRRWLEEAKLGFGASAAYLEHLDGIQMSPEQLKFLEALPDPMFRESVRDFMVNQQFRRDYWVKGGRRAGNAELASALRGLRLVLSMAPDAVPMKAKGPHGEASLQLAIYQPILALLADHRPRRVDEIEAGLRGSPLSFSQLIQALVVLVGQGALQPAQDDATIEAAAASSARLNAALLRRVAEGAAEINVLASPVTGGGINLNRMQLLFLHARLTQPGTPPEAWGEATWRILAAEGRRLVKDGTALDTDADNLAEARALARRFADSQLAILRALGVA